MYEKGCENMNKKRNFGNRTIGIVFTMLIVGMAFLGLSSINVDAIWWNMDDGGGTLTTDTSSSYNLVFSTEDNEYCYPGWIKESSEIKGLYFSGPNDDKGYHLHQTSDYFEFQSSFSINAKIKLSSDRPHYGTICSKFDFQSGNPDDIYFGFFFGICGNQLRLVVGDGSSTLKSVYTPPTVPNDEWIYATADCDLDFDKLTVRWTDMTYDDQGFGEVDLDPHWSPSPATNMDLHVGQCCESWGGGSYRPMRGRMDYLSITGS